MKSSRICGTAAVGVGLCLWGLVCWGARPLAAQDAPGQMDPAAMQKMWDAYAQPGPEHEVFKACVGSWKAELKEFMPNPTEPTVSEGSSEFKLVMDGRFLIQHFHATMHGKPFEGIGILGYDNAQKKYVGAWIDNLGTGVMHTEGTFDPGTKTMTETGTMISPLGPMRLKMVTEYKGDREFVFTMYMVGPDGSDMKSMEIRYTRK